MSDLRQSGAIEQDADVIVFVHRDEQAEPNKPEANGTAELIVAKNRDGEVGTVHAAFRGEYSRFENLAHSV
jgi:replicative DNA helicase